MSPVAACAATGALLTGYDFSSFFPVTVNSASAPLVFSSGSTFFLTTVSNRLILRQTTTLTVARSWLCGSTATQLSHLAFSTDTAYALAVSLKLGLCWVFGLGDGDEPLAVIKAGPEGITRAEFGPAAHRREVLVWSDHGLRLTVHDLASGQSSIITNPKPSAGPSGHAFTYSGSEMVLLESHNGKTVVGVYSLASGGPYQLMHHFILHHNPPTMSLSPSTLRPHLLLPHPVLSPAGYKLEVYNPIGIHIGSFGWQDKSFEMDAQRERTDPGSSIRCAQWGPGGKWVGIGGSDSKVRIIECDGWRCIKTIGYENKDKRGHSAQLWKEPQNWYKDTRGQGIIQFSRQASTTITPSIKRDMASPNAKTGVSIIDWSHDGTYFFSQVDSQPTTVHLHSFLSSSEAPTPVIQRIAQIHFSAPVRAVKWSTDPKRPKRLAVATGGGAVYFWDGDEEWDSGAVTEAVGLPGGANFNANELVWAPDGQALAIIGKDQYCMVYDSLEEDSLDSIPRTPSAVDGSFASA